METLRDGNPNLSRRLLLGAGAAAGLLGVPAHPAAAQALRPGAHLDVIRKIEAGRSAQPGRVRIRMAEIVENGASVPVTVSADGPADGPDRIKALHVIADDNPNPEIFSAEFGPDAPRAEIATRIRLSKTMNVIAFAETADGKLFRTAVEARVTVGGCGA
jgi:sulfur-oxidizing protein SoxY